MSIPHLMNLIEPYLMFQMLENNGFTMSDALGAVMKKFEKNMRRNFVM